MDDMQRYRRQIDAISTALQQKLNLRPAPFARLVARSRSQLPRKVYRQARVLVEAEPLAAHPRLSRTLDFARLERSGAALLDHLNAIDLADARKGRVLSLLGSLSFNLLAVVALLIAVLMWRGFL
ncbi:hypothetical protein [Aestuariivita sp.]|jgi:hypothetical protein|uniref:hypothetical protein n=1 Tax=Aestuariivita sp. TaxID=1872407 RepID=UPI002172C92C|nr:hypothetical protein [Aestuariivita sp.]MCE8007513.1 hypothetical protein [Aestuariivita sp.]